MEDNDILKDIDTDWGAPGALWSGKQVQDWIKTCFRKLLTKSQSIEKIVKGEDPENQMVIPVANEDTIGGVKSTKTGTAEGRDFYVEVEADGKMKVNVPAENSTLTPEEEEKKKQEEEKAKQEAEEQKKKVDFLYGKEEVDSVESIPIGKRLVVATISTSQTFQLAEKPEDGVEIHVILKNSSEENVTVALPNSGGYESMVDTSLTIKGNGKGEINVISDGETMYIRAAAN